MRLPKESKKSLKRIAFFKIVNMVYSVGRPQKIDWPNHPSGGLVFLLDNP